MIHPRTVESSVAHSVEVPTLVLYRGSLGVAVLALVATLLFSCTHSTKAPTAAQSIDSLMTKLHEQGYFNGAVVVGRGDEIVYEGGFGYANVEERALFTPEDAIPEAEKDEIWVELTLQPDSAIRKKLNF